MPFAVGDTLTVPAYSFRLIGGGPYTTTTTCRYVGENCYVFVEDEVWGGVDVDQARVDGIAESFDQTTNRDPARGIYDIVTDVFGDAPDVDGDPRILIVLLDVLDSPFTGSSVVGYFDINNQSGQVMREVVYLDTNPLGLSSELARATLAHEFQHMIHWNGDGDEAKWVDEGCSEYAELACGYKDTTETAGETFLIAPNNSLTVWEDLPFDFDQAYMFFAYFVGRFGESVLRPLVANETNGIDGVNESLETLGSARYADVFFDWAAATYFDGEDDLGYERITVGQVDRDTVSVASRIVRRARLWGSDFIVLDQPGQYDITLESLGDNDVAATLLIRDPEPTGQITIQALAGGTVAASLYSGGLEAVTITSTSGSSEEYAISFSPNTLVPGTPNASDADRDGDVDFNDFLSFAAHYATVAGRLGYNPTFDYNTDRSIDFSDFLIFAGHFGTSF